MPRALVAGQYLLWPAGLTGHVAGRLGGPEGHGLQIFWTEKADQDALATVIPGDPRDDADLGARIPRGVPVTSGGLGCRALAAPGGRLLVLCLEPCGGCVLR